MTKPLIEEFCKWPGTGEVRYEFSDWSGNEDVFNLCQKYIQELKNVVKEGKSKGFIKG